MCVYIYIYIYIHQPTCGRQEVRPPARPRVLPGSRQSEQAVGCLIVSVIVIVVVIVVVVVVVVAPGRPSELSVFY